MATATPEQILDVLANVAETDEVRTNQDLALYDLQILDSMKTVELIVALSSEFSIDVSPAEFERENLGHPAQAGGRCAASHGGLMERIRKTWIELHPRTRFVLLTFYYFAIIAALIALYGRGDFSTPGFVYQEF